MDKCNEYATLSEIMTDLGIEPQPDYDYGLATDDDVFEYTIHSLAASAAICNIENYVYYFDQIKEPTLQQYALYNYLKQFDFDMTFKPIKLLDIIRKNALNNAFICKEWDTIKCFLRLMSCSGIPISVTNDGKDDCGCCDGYSETIIKFKHFEIIKTTSEDRFEDCETAGWSYAISVDYSQLKLILSGDVETNPGPTVQSRPLDEIQKKKINSLQREVEKLKKAQLQQQHFVQRQLELEKRNRKKNRKISSHHKRYAQTIVGDTINKIKEDISSVCNNSSALSEMAKTAGYVATNMVLPGAGTAAATIVNGSKITSAVNRLNPTVDILQGILNTLSDAAADLRSLFRVPDSVDLISVLITMVSILNSLMQKQLLLLTLYCTSLARQLGVTLDSLLSLVPSFDSMTDIIYTSKSETQRVGQSLVTDMFATAKSMPELLPFTGFLSFLCGVFSLACTGTVPTPTEMTKHFSCIGRAAQGFRAVKELFVWIFDYLAEIYYSTVYGLSVEEYKFMQQFPRLENLYAAVKLVEKFDKSLIDSSAAIANQILTINHELNDYHYQASRMNSRSNSHLISSLQKRIKEHVSWATSCPARCHTIRTQPVAMYLFGHPGVGKSVATEVLKARIYKKYLADKGIKYESTAFTRRAKNEYWEGYTGQPIVILDDFGNVRDSQQKPVEEYEELEYMVNTAQYPLNMATLSLKGVTNFTSEYIIASSNQKFPEIKSLVDPGAVYRRFHVWAEVTIDPAYGVPIGKDETGNAYYTFDKAMVAKTQGIALEDVSPLTVEHYRFTCYKVNHNKQTGNAEVQYIPGKSSLKFDEFWDYFVEENNRRKTESTSLAAAIRAEAGIDTPAAPASELEIMEQFDKIFNPEKFLQAVASDDNFKLDDDDEFEDASSDVTFGSISHMFKVREKYTALKDMFEANRKYCNTEFSNLWSSLKSCVSRAKNGLLSVAEFILSFFSSLANKTIQHLPSVPTSKVLFSVCSTAAAFFGIWYTGIFRRGSPDKVDYWCQFNRKPSNATVPCGNCEACKIIEYPSSGNMLDHFLDRTGIKSVRNDLLSLGINRDDLEDIREQLRREKPIRRNKRKCQILLFANEDDPDQTYEEAYRLLTSTCLAGCEICDSLDFGYLDMTDESEVIEAARSVWSRFSRCESESLFAQRVYDSQPVVPKPRNYAQKVYESQPRQVKPKNFAQRIYSQNPTVPKTQRLAQGLVECKTEMHIGARKYAQRDRVQIEQTTQVLLNNSVWIQAVDGKGLCCRSNGVFLVGRTMITTAHTVLNPPHIDPIEYLIIRNPYSIEAAIKVPINQCKISQAFQLDGSPVDLALISFPPVVPNRPKILSKFINSQDIDLLKEGDLTFSGFYEINGKTIVQEKYPSSFSVSCKTTEYYLHKPGTCPKSVETCKCPIKIGNHIDYDLETVSGMCGALLSISNKLIHTKLIGFHVAGGAGVLALGALTTRQFLEQALNAHIDQFQIPKSYLIDGRLPYSQSWVDPKYQTSLIQLGDCLNVGSAPAPAAPVKTQLAPSLIFDKVQEHIAKPAYLQPVNVEGEGLVDPMIKGIKKIMGPQTFIDPDLLEAAANDVFSGLGKPPGNTGVVHTYEEAIRGVEGDPYKRPINRTTSPGYPYNLTNRLKGKTAWLGDGEEYIVDNPELKHDVTDLLSKARQGIRGDAISIATLKDEKRPIAKVDAGKTRVFEACPQHLVIAIRQYFLDFAAHVMRNRITNGIAVGINPYSLEWTKLAHHLQSKGNYMIAGDFSNFDGSLLMQVLVKIVEKINEWYGDSEENQLIRAALWEHICNADILVKGEVIRKTHSQPSGNPLTVIINSLFNGIVMRIAYMMLKKGQGLPLTCDYREHVSEIIYGDDDIKSVSGEIIDWFNQLTLTDALKSFGLTYTDETKTGLILPFKPLEDVAFLKRKFVIQSDGTFMAPMDLENVLEITNWVRGKATKAATLENCEQAIMELALHKRPVYEYWGNRIREELAKVKLNIRLPTYFEQQEAYRYNRDMYARVDYVPLW